MGCDFAEADMEKAFASMQELDPEEMEKAAGGEFCWSDYDCFTILHHDSPNDFHHDCFWFYSCILIHFLTREGNPYIRTSFRFDEKARTEHK